MFDLTPEETTEYLAKVYNRLLEHRYRYYVLNEAAISDFEHDWFEREYNRMATEHGVKLMEMVDFDFKDPLALAAKDRVDQGIDSHSLWEKEMRPIWNRIGLPNKRKKENA